jgi:hypothetical protein
VTAGERLASGSGSDGGKRSVEKKNEGTLYT